MDDLSMALAASGGISETEYFVIDNDLRSISIPSSMKIAGVENDDDINRIPFRMPRYVKDTDLSEFQIRINYINALGEGDLYMVTDKTVEEDTITFSWLLDRHAFASKGEITFTVCARLIVEGSLVDKEYNTTIHKLTVLQGLETDKAIPVDVQDHFLDWLQEEADRQLTAIQSKGTEVLNSIPSDYQDLHTDVVDLKSAVSDLPFVNVSSESSMTDTGKIYRFDGALWFYDGAEWAQVGTGSGGDASADLPKLFITGDINEMTAGVEVKKYSYVFVDSDGKQNFGYCSMKWQGESSLSYPKKNYTLKFFYDASHKRKEKVNLLPLGLTKSKFVIKANWIDQSQARNIVSCRLWGQMVKSRHTAPPELLASAPNYGAINGYPIKLYVNGDFHGLYTFNVPKDEDLFAMDAENPRHCVVCGDNNANNNDNASAFRSAVIGTSWELEVPDTWQTYDEEIDGQTATHAVKDNLSDTIAFVINTTDEEFIDGLNDHIDVESAIDYFLLMFIDRGVDSAARNLILLTYDGGNKWYCSAYDKDMTWGVASAGNAAYIADTPCPSGYLNSNSLLWERLVECFGDEIWERWQELKTTILSPDYIKAEFDYFWKNITDADYEADVEEWPTIPQAAIDFKYMLNSLIDARWMYMDGCIDDMRTPVPCTGIALDRSTISFSDGTPVTLTATLTPANTTERVIWTSSDTSVATVSNGVVTPVGAGNATITVTCGEQTATCSVTASAISYTVTLSGSGATLSPTANVSAGAPYSGTLTADAGYAIDGVVVTMGGTDITASAYGSGTITIAAVTGNIVVTVSTSVNIDPTGLVYMLQSPLTFDGQTYVDTGFTYDGTGALSIVIDAVNPQDMSTAQYFFGQVTGSTGRGGWRAPSRGMYPGLNGDSIQSGVGGIAGVKFISVLRYNPTTKVASLRTVVNGTEVTYSSSYNKNGNVAPRDAWGNTLYIGGRNTNGTLTEPMLSGKLNQLRIYTRRLTDSETAALLGISALSDVMTVDKDEAEQQEQQE